MLLEGRMTGISQGIHLLALNTGAAQPAPILQHLQSRVYCTGAGRIEASGLLFQLLYELIAMLGPLV
jgi:hypothetical protein